VTFFATDFVGNGESPHTHTVNIDKTRPVIAGMPGADCVLWPPNGAWHHVATVLANDGLSGLAPDSVQVRVENSEAPEADDDADVRVVASGAGAREVWLRAKRLGKGSGRRYSITASAADLAGNAATSTAMCLVPHDRRK
jgi:hypothetical protein